MNLFVDYSNINGAAANVPVAEQRTNGLPINSINRNGTLVNVVFVEKNTTKDTYG
jgi:hypothetical protein